MPVLGLSGTCISPTDTDCHLSLRAVGVHTRTVDPGPPIAVSYALTTMGESLVDLLKPLVLWANDNMDGIKGARDEYEKASR